MLLLRERKREVLSGKLERWTFPVVACIFVFSTFFSELNIQFSSSFFIKEELVLLKFQEREYELSLFSKGSDPSAVVLNIRFSSSVFIKEELAL